MLPVGCDNRCEFQKLQESRQSKLEEYRKNFAEKCTDCEIPKRENVLAILQYEDIVYTKPVSGYPGLDTKPYTVDNKVIKVFYKDKTYLTFHVWSNGNCIMFRDFTGKMITLSGEYVLEESGAKVLFQDELDKAVKFEEERYQTALQAYKDCVKEKYPELPEDFYFSLQEDK